MLPVLQPGVTVHFHDIFLPWEYPRQWFAEMHWYWAEQYLLQAFLAYNRTLRSSYPRTRSHATIPSDFNGSYRRSARVRLPAPCGSSVSDRQSRPQAVDPFKSV